MVAFSGKRCLSCLCRGVDDIRTWTYKYTDSHLNWRNRIDQIIPKLSVTCYIVRQMYHICNNDTLRSIYFVNFHSNASYGIILWGNSSYSRKIFSLQKRIIRIMMGAHHRTSCRKLFKKLEILTVPSLYIYIYTHTHTLIYIFSHSLVFSLRGRVGRNQSPVMWPVWLWHTASWASSLG